MRSADNDTDHSLTAAHRPVATVREEELRVAARAEVDALDAFDAGRAKGALAARPEIEFAFVPDVVAEAFRERPRDLVPHLVAARADCGPDRRRSGNADGAHALRDHAFEQTAPTRVQDREARLAVGRRDRDRQAVGREREHRYAGLVRPEPVARLAAPPGVGPVHRRGVLLPVERQPRGVGADGFAEAPSVLLDVVRVVAGHAAEVERGVRAFTDAAEARREGDCVTLVRRPAEELHRSSSASSSRRSRVFSSGSSTTCASSWSSVCPITGPWGIPSSSRSPPSTARSATRCGWSRSATSEERASATSPPCASRSSTRLNASSSPWRARNRRTSTGSLPGSSSVWPRTSWRTLRRSRFG